MKNNKKERVEKESSIICCNKLVRDGVRSTDQNFESDSISLNPDTQISTYNGT